MKDIILNFLIVNLLISSLSKVPGSDALACRCAVETTPPGIHTSKQNEYVKEYVKTLSFGALKVSNETASCNGDGVCVSEDNQNGVARCYELISGYRHTVESHAFILERGCINLLSQRKHSDHTGLPTLSYEFKVGLISLPLQSLHGLRVCNSNSCNNHFSANRGSSIGLSRNILGGMILLGALMFIV